MIVPAVSAARPVSMPTTIDKAGTSAASSNNFVNGLENVQASLDNADKLAGQLASGQLTDVHTYMAAATKAGVGGRACPAARAPIFAPPTAISAA